ncbi:hypothetical protein [Bradyrhizobium sp. AUGA SZCCT0182]|uniref:hypothetical protein n=1 Tax=Bradyrhizobium sp. AUGA SZCCT0182 TaxID=2807667 RepID=UPI001BA8DBE3|nr:hypothetical protein [Bradyrhizobium sp. AUGA SZCCT0182]MBR1235188.1 hypothetical protein [Bradyrhizobium sp. AUGA SZCCT0182]
MKLEEVVFGWTPKQWDWHPTTGQIDVGLIGDRRWAAMFGKTEGALAPEWRTMPNRERRMFQLFNLIVVADGIDPQMAHAAFLKIDEYRWGIARDVPGAEARP